MQVDRAFSDLVGRIYDCSLDKDLWHKFIQDKKHNPPIGKGPTESVVTAVETLLL